MRYYLDTNILAFLYTNRQDELSTDVVDGVLDFSNTLLTSTVCVNELIHLCQTGKLSYGRVSPNPTAVLSWLHDIGISVEQVNEHHLQLYSELPIMGDHTDPMDRMIIAQAISDHIPLVSSDRKFTRYERYGLEFIFNER